MHELDAQRKYWDAAAASALFTHPLDVDELRRYVGDADRILDFGFGSSLGGLAQAGMW